MSKRRKLGFIERQRLRKQIERFLAAGLDQLETGAELPAEGEPRGEWIPPGSHKDLSATVNMDRLRNIAAKRGMSEAAVFDAALKLGRRADS